MRDACAMILYDWCVYELKRVEENMMIKPPRRQETDCACPTSDSWPIARTCSRNFCTARSIGNSKNKNCRRKTGKQNKLLKNIKPRFRWSSTSHCNERWCKCVLRIDVGTVAIFNTFRRTASSWSNRCLANLVNSKFSTFWWGWKQIFWFLNERNAIRMILKLVFVKSFVIHFRNRDAPNNRHLGTQPNQREQTENANKLWYSCTNRNKIVEISLRMKNFFNECFLEQGRGNAVETNPSFMQPFSHGANDTYFEHEKYEKSLKDIQLSPKFSENKKICKIPGRCWSQAPPMNPSSHLHSTADRRRDERITCEENLVNLNKLNWKMILQSIHICQYIDARKLENLLRFKI